MPWVRRAPARLAGLTLVVLVLAALCGPALTAAPGDAPEGPRARVARVARVARIAPVALVAQVGPAGRISLASQTPWVEPDGAFEVRIDLTGVRRPDALALEVSVHEAVTSRSQFSRTLAGDLLGDDLWRQGPVPLSELELDAAGAVRVVVPVASGSSTAPGEVAPLVLGQAGVHPVRVVLVDTEVDTEADSFVTHLVRSRDDDAAPLAVAWIQPVGASPALQPDGSVTLDEASRATVDILAAALATSDVPFSVVPRPETVDALAAAAPETLERLVAAVGENQVVAAPYVEIDAAALVAAGLGDVVDAQRDRGAAVGERLAATVDRRTWVSPLSLDAATLARSPGVERLVLAEAALAPLERPLTLVNPFLVEDAGGRLVPSAAVDPQLQSHFTTADPVLGAHRLLADLAVLAYDSPGLERGVVVQPPPAWSASADFLAVALPALDSRSVVRPVTVDELFDGVPLGAAATGDGDLVRALAPRRPRASPGFDGTELRRVRADLDSYAAMVAPDDPAADLARRLVLVSSAASLSPAERTAYLAGARQVVGDRLAAVGILSEGSFRLTSREATIPLTLVNDLDVDVDVMLALESDKLDFVRAPDAGGTTTGSTVIPLALEPGRTPVMVSVEARTSGDFPLVIELRSPDGRLEMATARLTVRSTSLSGVGILVSAGAGLFLCGWWARHWRSARRDRRLVTPPSA